MSKSKKDNKKMVNIRVDLTDEEFLTIAKAAHREDMSVNDWCEMALRESLDG